MSDKIKEIFVEPQTCYKFTDKEVANDILNELYNLVKWGPTSFNSSPMRLKFLKSSTSKEKLSKLVSDDNICLLYTSPSPRDMRRSRMPSSA